MAKIYTRTGDTGKTSLLGGRRVAKDDLRIEAIGSVDEINAAIGVVRMELTRAIAAPEALDEELAQVQHRLFDLGAELAGAGPVAADVARLSNADVAALEASIDRYEAGLEPLKYFILPGGSPVAAQLHVARGVCRRAERRLVELTEMEAVRGEALRYINRLSDWLFVAARVANRAIGVADIRWERSSGQGGMP